MGLQGTHALYINSIITINPPTLCSQLLSSRALSITFLYESPFCLYTGSSFSLKLHIPSLHFSSALAPRYLLSTVFISHFLSQMPHFATVPLLSLGLDSPPLLKPHRQHSWFHPLSFKPSISHIPLFQAQVSFEPHLSLQHLFPLHPSSFAPLRGIPRRSIHDLCFLETIKKIEFPHIFPRSYLNTRYSSNFFNW